MSYTAQEKTDTMTGRMTRLNGGSLELLSAASQVIASIPLNSPAGTVSGATGTFSGFPKSVSPTLTGVAIASAQIKDSGAVVRNGSLSVGLPGSGAQVVLSKLTPAAGETVTVNAPFTMTDL